MLQWPIWKPYEIYASIDHVYGWPGWENKDGFGGAQGVLNVVEIVMYGLYAMIVYNHGVPAAAGTGLQVGHGVSGWFAGGVKVRGKAGNRALIIGFAAAVMTLSKTVLYCEYLMKSQHLFFSLLLSGYIWLTTRKISMSISPHSRMSNTMTYSPSSYSTSL